MTKPYSHAVKAARRDVQVRERAPGEGSCPACWGTFGGLSQAVSGKHLGRVVAALHPRNALGSC